MSKAYVTLPVGYKRIDAQPLEAGTLFTSIDSAEEYAKTDPTAYPGQTLTVLYPDRAWVYIIQPDMSLVRISSVRLEYQPQSSPYTIDHGMGCYPDVLVIDNNNYLCTCSVQYPSKNQVIVSWNGTFTGLIVLQS